MTVKGWRNWKVLSVLPTSQELLSLVAVWQFWISVTQQRAFDG